MNTEKSKLKGLSQTRFSSLIFLFRMAGIPFQMKKISTIYAAYMVTVVICSFSTFIGTFVDVCIHWDDLGRAMRTMRVFIMFTNVMWLFSNCR
jgi:kynurenine formamidase